MINLPTSFIAYGQILIGALLNIFAIYMLKKADGFTVLWPSVIALVCICATQILLSRAMQSGLDMGFAVTLLVIAVMVGSSIMGIFLFHESLMPLKIVGLMIAVIGVTIASIAKSLP